MSLFLKVFKHTVFSLLSTSPISAPFLKIFKHTVFSIFNTSSYQYPFFWRFSSTAKNGWITKKLTNRISNCWFENEPILIRKFGNLFLPTNNVWNFHEAEYFMNYSSIVTGWADGRWGTITVVVLLDRWTDGWWETCILPVDSCHGTTIVMSDCTIVTSGHHGSIRTHHLYQIIVQFDKIIVLPKKRATGSIHDYLFCYSPLVGILFEVLRIGLNMACYWNIYGASHM